MRIRTLFTAIIAAVSLTSLASFSPVLAQHGQSISLKDVRVSIWPEYDDLAQLGYPSVLVILEGEIVSDNVPVTMRFLVPGDAVIYLAGSGPRDEYLEATPARKASNITGWDELSFELFTKYFVVEYYAPIIGQPDRVIPYDFYTLYPVSGLGAEVQEPRRSKSFSVSPEGLIRSDDGGFRYHTYEYANDSPDAPLHFDISYTKADSRPSLDTGGSLNTTVLIVLGVIVVLTGAFILVSKFLKSRPRPAAARSLRRQAAHASKRGQSSSKGKYCSECGKATDSTSRFCTYCGNELD